MDEIQPFLKAELKLAEVAGELVTAALVDLYRLHPEAIEADFTVLMDGEQVRLEMLWK